MTFPFSNLLGYQLQVFGIYLVSVYLKKKEFVIILFCGFVYVFCAEYCTYVLHVPFIELSLALNILL